jgi:hypothetical protein
MDSNLYKLVRSRRLLFSALNPTVLERKSWQAIISFVLCNVCTLAARQRLDLQDAIFYEQAC